MRRSLAIGVAAACACASPMPAAEAEPPWSPPLQVPGSSSAPLRAPSLALGTAGRGIVAWSSPPVATNVSIRGVARFAAVSGAGPGPARDLPPYDLAAPVAAYGQERTIALLTRNTPGSPPDENGHSPQQDVAVAFGAGGALGPARVLSRAVSPTVGDADLAVNPRGDAVAVWVQGRGTGRTGRALDDRLWISTRRAGGSFVAPTILIGSGRLGDVGASVGANGDVAVAFTREAIVRGHERRPRRVAVRYRRSGHRFGRIQDIGPNEGFADIATALAADGRAYVGWGTQDVGIEADLPFRVYAAVKPAGARRFRKGVQLDAGGGHRRPVGNVSLGVRDDGVATLAWSGVRGSRASGDFDPVLAATTDAMGRFGPALPVSGGNGKVGGVAVSADGTTTVVWTALRPGEGLAAPPGGVLAAQRPAGTATFGAPETVTDQPQRPDDGPPAVALDPSTGRPVVAIVGGAGVLVSARTG